MSDTASPAPSSRSRKIRAVLAGGLVLGVGAAITLAAWNDSEFATGTFEAGSFNLEGSLDGSTFDDHDEENPAAELDFTVDASNLSPGDSVSAPFAVRLDETTTYDADVAVNAAGTDGTVAGLTYTLVTTEAFGCDSTEESTLIDTSPVGEVDADGAAFALAAGADAEPGAAVNLCFTVTAGDDLDQDQSGTASWEFLATSED